MPGLYQRDNLAPQLAQAIENAQRRRESIRAIKAQRDRENVNAALNFAKALGRTYETSPSVLAKKRQELLDEMENIKAVKAHEQEVQDKYNEQVALRNRVNDYFTSMNAQGSLDEKMQNYSGPTQSESYAEAMRGYEPSRVLHIPGYADTALGLLGDRAELESRLDDNFTRKYGPRPTRGLY